MDNFVGGDRQHLVDSLVEAFKGISEGQGPRMVVLSAPSGEGKTRIVQEFYRRIAATQATPVYWPAQIVNDDIADWKYDRKRLSVASFTPEPGASIPWLYWSVSCHRRPDNVPAQALFDDLTQFQVHAEPLFNKLERGELAGTSFDGVSALLSVFGVLGVLTVGGPVGAAIVMVGAARTVVQNKDLATKFKDWFARHKQAESGELVLDGQNHGRSDQIQELAHNVVKVSKGLPIVLAVDDAHWADPTLTSFLDVILQSHGAHVLIVATCWPETADDLVEEGSFGAWCESLQSETVTRIALEPLGQQDLLTLVRAVYSSVAHDDDPVLGDEIAEVLIERFSSPIGIRAFFGLDAVQRAIHSGGLERGDLDVLPATLDKVMDDYWNELPPEVQHVVAVAAVVGERFAPQPVIAAAELLGQVNPLEHLEASRNPFRLIRAVEESLDVFTDMLFQRTAQSQGQFLPRDLVVIDNAVAAYAATLDPKSTSRQLGSFVWAAHVGRAEQGRVDRGPAANSAWNLAILSAETYDYIEAIRYGRLALEWTDSTGDEPDLYEKRLYLAIWLGESGQVEEAIGMERALLNDQIRVLGPDSPDTLTTRTNLAFWLGQSGKVEEAITMLQVLLEDWSRVLGPDAPTTLTTRNNLAYQLAKSGRVEEALYLFRALLEEQTRSLGPDAPDTLTTRNNLAGWLAESGRVDEALEMFRALLEDQIRVTGPDSRHALTTRSGLAVWLARSGRDAEAMDMNRTLLEDRTRVLGPYAPDTLTTRNNLANSLADSGSVDEAVEMFRALVDDRTRVLGPDAPDTLTTRGNLADCLAQSGDVDEAIAMIRLLLQDQTRILGSDARETLTTRGGLASWLARTGHLDEAIQMFRSLLGDQTRILGSDAPDTLRTRNNLAYSLAESGQDYEAIEMYEVLLLDRSRILGPDAPGTLTTKNNLAVQLAQSGRIAEGVELLRSLLEDQNRVLGPDDTDTIATRCNLASWLAENSEVDEAIAISRALIRDLDRIQGVDSPGSVAMAEFLAQLEGGPKRRRRSRRS